MKLDSRIIEGKKPLTCFDAEEAKQFIGKEGYFAGDLSVYQKLDYFQTWTLQEIKNNISRCFKDNVLNEHWNYFLPKEWVKELEKKYRPFSIEDWKFKHSIGETVLYRSKVIDHGDRYEAEVMYLGYIKPLDGITDEVGAGELVLGKNSHSLQYLFDNYEIWLMAVGNLLEW